jgi:hypothetical protein
VNYLAALVLTVAVEAPLYGLSLPRLGDVERRAAAGAGAVVNLVSHPLAWFVAWPLFRTVVRPGPAFVAVEVLVVTGEWMGLRRWRRFDPPLLAALVVAVNAASIAAGAAL